MALSVDARVVVWISSVGLTVTTAYSSINPLFEPAKRHRNDSIKAARERRTGMSAENLILPVLLMM